MNYCNFGSFFTALVMSMKLNEAKLIQEVIENIPVRDSKGSFDLNLPMVFLI